MLHYKQRFSDFPSPAGMSLTKLSLAGNNLPGLSPRKVWSKKIQESRNFCLQCIGCKLLPVVGLLLAALGLAGAVGHKRVRLIADPLRLRAGRVRAEQIKDDILNYR